MTIQSASRLNISFIDINSLDGAFQVFSKPIPCMAKRAGVNVLVYPLFTKVEWFKHLSTGSKNIKINPHWREKEPLKLSEDDFTANFIPLQGEEGDSVMICGLRPAPSDAIKVNIPACIERNGRIIYIDNNDVLISNKLGAKMVLSEESLSFLYAQDADPNHLFDFKVSTEPSQDNEMSYSF